MTSIGERFRSIRQLYKLSQEAFGKKINLSQANITDIERGKVSPNITIMEKFHNELLINLNWLICGKGKMKLIEEGLTVEEPYQGYEIFKDKYIEALETNRVLNDRIFQLSEELRWYHDNCECPKQNKPGKKSA